MATIISTKTSGVGGLEVTGDATGILQLASNNGTTAVTVDASQNVGIGTASPTQKLQVYTSAGSGGQIQITNSSTGATSTDGVLIGYDGSNDVIFNNQEATQTKFYTSGTERMRITAAGLVQYNNGYGSVATAYGCRAWVNFNGTGTVAIRGSGNVTSITDAGTGNYIINFTTAMPDTNYAFAGVGSAGGAMNAGNLAYNWDANNKTTSALQVYTISTSYTPVDANQANVVVFR